MPDLTTTEKEINDRFIRSYNTLKSMRRVGKKGDFCESLGLRREYFSRYEKDELVVSDDAINNLSKIYQISKDWVLYNRGEMFEKGEINSGQYSYAGRDSVQAGGSITQNSKGDCEQQLAAALKEIEHLSARLKDKDQLLANKDQMISLLMKAQG